MSNEIIMYGLLAVLALFVAIVIAYVIIRKKMNTEDAKKERELRAGTENNSL